MKLLYVPVATCICLFICRLWVPHWRCYWSWDTSRYRCWS